MLGLMGYYLGEGSRSRVMLLGVRASGLGGREDGGVIGRVCVVDRAVFMESVVSREREREREHLQSGRSDGSKAGLVSSHVDPAVSCLRLSARWPCLQLRDGFRHRHK